MATPRLNVSIRGGSKVRSRLDVPRLAGAAARSWNTRTAKLIADDARTRAPRWRGRIQRTIRHKLTRATWPPTAEVRVGAGHARYVHGGLDTPPGRTRPHWPPRSAIEPWARAKGIPWFLVARSIAQRGTPTVKFLSDAIRANEARLDDMTSDLVPQVERAWGD